MSDYIRTPEFEELDHDFDLGVSVAKGSAGAFCISANSEAGRSNVKFWMHPRMAEKLRDWLVKNYPEGETYK